MRIRAVAWQACPWQVSTPGLREYHPLLAEAVPTTGVTWKKDPSRWPSYKITPATPFGSIMTRIAPNAKSRPAMIIAATPFFMGIAALKFKSGDMEAMGKNLGGSVMLFLVPKIVETIITWAAK